MLLLDLLGVITERPLLWPCLRLGAAVCCGKYTSTVSLWAKLLILVLQYLPSSLLGAMHVPTLDSMTGGRCLWTHSPPREWEGVALCKYICCIAVLAL